MLLRSLTSTDSKPVNAAAKLGTRDTITLDPTGGGRIKVTVLPLRVNDVGVLSTYTDGVSATIGTAPIEAGKAYCWVIPSPVASVIGTVNSSVGRLKSSWRPSAS